MSQHSRRSHGRAGRAGRAVRASALPPASPLYEEHTIDEIKKYLHENDHHFLREDEYCGQSSYAEYLAEKVQATLPPIKFLHHSLFISLPYVVRGMCLQMLNNKMSWFSQRLQVLHNSTPFFYSKKE